MATSRNMQQPAYEGEITEAKTVPCWPSEQYQRLSRRVWRALQLCVKFSDGVGPSFDRITLRRSVFAVGTPISERRPRRSVRAEFAFQQWLRRI